MYSPTTRLLTLLELLQTHPQLSGKTVAEKLEVDRRTVRRYFERLQDMGIPIEVEYGPLGGYRLQRGYKMPPLMLTNQEAQAITLGLLLLKELKLSLESEAVSAALAKTQRLMPKALLDKVQAIESAVHFEIHLHHMPEALLWVPLLSQAVYQNQSISLDYTNAHKQNHQRVFDPYGIIMYQGYWYTAGYCHLRQAVRTFRLDRIQKADTLESTFQRPKDFDTLDYVRESLGAQQQSFQIDICLETDLTQAQIWCQPFDAHYETVPQGTQVCFRSSNLHWVCHFLLTLHCPWQLKGPQELQEMIYHKGQALMQQSHWSANTFHDASSP